MEACDVVLVVCPRGTNSLQIRTLLYVCSLSIPFHVNFAFSGWTKTCTSGTPIQDGGLILGKTGAAASTVFFANPLALFQSFPFKFFAKAGSPDQFHWKID